MKTNVRTKTIQMKKFRLILLITICSGLLFACVDTTKKNETNKTKSEVPENPKLAKLKTEASRLRGGGSVKTVTLEEGKATITYVKNYSEYKEINPQSGLTRNDIENYWESGDAIKKALVDGSIRIMRKLDYINEVKIILPYKGKTYSIDVQKSELEKFIGSDFKTIVDNWDEEFSNPFVYDDNGREKFFKKFGNIK